jgi:hypothetical protein
MVRRGWREGSFLTDNSHNYSSLVSWALWADLVAAIIGRAPAGAGGEATHVMESPTNTRNCQAQ